MKPNVMHRKNFLRRMVRPERRGAAVVEFAVVAPIFVLFTLGIIEFGRMAMVQQILTTAAREGARTAIADGTPPEEIVATVETYLAGGGITGAHVKTATSDTARHGEPVTVSVSVPFSQVSWLPAPMFVGNTTLNSTSIMRRETPK